MGQGYSSVIECCTKWSEGRRCDPQQEQLMNFLLPKQFSVLTYFGIFSRILLPQKHVKDPSHSAESTDDRLQLNTRTSLTQWSWTRLTMLSRHRVGSNQGNKLKCNSSRSARPQMSRLAQPLWTNPWPKEWNWFAQDDLHFKKNNKQTKAQARNDSSNLPPLPP